MQTDNGLAPLVDGNTAFAVDLYHRLRDKPGNLFFSPTSISTALAMTYAGARGETAVQMAHTLHFTLPEEQLHPAFNALQDHLSAVQAQGAVALHVANSLWPQLDYAFLAAFLDICERHYGVAITPVDYGDSEAARRRINAWVEEETQEKIKELLKPPHVNPLTTLILVNAIYFKGDWASQFDAARTQPAPFWVTPQKSAPTPLMAQTLTCGYAEFDALQALELPYVGDELSMIVLLPREQDGLAALERQLTAANLARWRGAIRRREVEAWLPRFKLESEFELNKTLAALGMVDAFGDAADFSGMTGQRNLFISAVVHKAFVDVNENGTEAAAATAVGMTLSIPPPPPTFRADHPFLFLIQERRTGSVLFLGRLVKPPA